MKKHENSSKNNEKSVPRCPRRGSAVAEREEGAHHLRAGLHRGLRHSGARWHGRRAGYPFSERGYDGMCPSGFHLLELSLQKEPLVKYSTSMHTSVDNQTNDYQKLMLLNLRTNTDLTIKNTHFEWSAEGCSALQIHRRGKEHEKWRPSK